MHYLQEIQCVCRQKQNNKNNMIQWIEEILHQMKTVVHPTIFVGFH